MTKQYSDRDIMALDQAGDYYLRHVQAMTKEQLHSKSDIAAELGHRDQVIDQLAADRDALATKLSEIRRVWDAFGGWPDTTAEMEALRVAVEGKGV